MKVFRRIFFIFAILSGAAIVLLFIVLKPKTPLDATLAPAFQLLGRTTSSLNKALTKMIPVDAIDEKEYGDAIALRYENKADKNDPDHNYVNNLMKHISQFKRKPFDYRVYIMCASFPNAFALPGGIVFVTKVLLDAINSEAELVSILAHEMGHIELSHCLDAVRFELLSKKIADASLGKLADFAVKVMLRHSFSKTQENEADEYAFKLILNTEYDSASLGNAFAAIIARGSTNKSDTKTDIINDYFRTHPHLLNREEKYTELARIWLKNHKSESKYRGVRNLKERVFYKKLEYLSEWTNTPPFEQYENGIVYESNSRLEWIAGPDKDTDWNQAQNWVKNLSVGGGGWQMPTRKELKTLYQKGVGSRNMTPLLETTGWRVWSGETKGSSVAWGFYFGSGYDSWTYRGSSYDNRGFAVRSRR